MLRYSCSRCIQDKKYCESCINNPKYKDLKSYYMDYIPVCPLGYTDCVNDPGYIKQFHPEWYSDLYGDKTIQEASATCQEIFSGDSEDICRSYDTEDK